LTNGSKARQQSETQLEAEGAAMLAKTQIDQSNLYDLIYRRYISVPHSEEI